MTIQKQVDNLIDWYALNKPNVPKQIVLDCSRSTVCKFAPCERKRVERKGKGKGEPTKLVYGDRMYRGYKIILAEKSDPCYKAQVDAFREAVR